MLPLSSLVPELERAIEEIDSGAVIGDRLQMDLEATIRRLSDELSDQKFLHVETRDIDIYESATPFGDVVAARFPFMREDISEAGAMPRAWAVYSMRIPSYEGYGGVRSVAWWATRNSQTEKQEADGNLSNYVGRDHG